MLRTYEMIFIVDPRLPDEEVTTIVDDYKRMATTAGGDVAREESWGKRRLAFPIEKLTEGRYFLLYVTAEDKNPLRDVQHRMGQNDKILRYLTVRTDRPVPLTELVPVEAETAPVVEEEA